MKRKTAEVSSKAAPDKELLPRAEAARKDSAVHVSLSSDSLFKQPGNHGGPPLRQTGEPSKPVHPRTIGCCFTVPVRSFRGAQSRRKRTARRKGYIGFAPRHCQPKTPNFVGAESLGRPRPWGSGAVTGKAFWALPRRTEAIFMGRACGSLRGMESQTGVSSRRRQPPGAVIDGARTDRHRAGHDLVGSAAGGPGLSCLQHPISDRRRRGRRAWTTQGHAA